MIDYVILKAIWWLFICVLFVGFTVMDGMDMGAGILLPFLGKNDLKRRSIINSVAPHWDGNQVWLLTGAGAIFAAWPLVYSVLFSGFYWAMLLVLFALILRPLGFEFRSKIQHPTWRNVWDCSLFIGSLLPAILFGIAVGNLLQGIPFTFDETMRVVYKGTFFQLLTPYTLLCGLVSMLLMVTHGANWLVLKTEGTLQQKAASVTTLTAVLTALLYAAAGAWTAFSIDGHVVISELNLAGISNPFTKTVDVYVGGWTTNFNAYLALWAIPTLGILGLFASAFFAKRLRGFAATSFSSLATACIVATPFVSMFPFVVPSSVLPSASLTLWDCTSSQLTLEIMFFVVLIFLPIVLFYTSWAYRVMRGKINDEYIKHNNHSLY